MPRPPSRFALWIMAVALLATFSATCSGEDNSASSATTAARTTATTSPAAAANGSGEQPLRDDWSADGWLTTSPEEQGMDSAVLADMIENATDYEIDSIAVIRNGYMVLDTTFYPLPPDTKHNIHSCTKSIVGTLVGLAIGDALVGGIDRR